MAYTNRYDRLIEVNSKAFLPWNWLWLKSQFIAESRLDPKAVSPVGAKGIPQFMDPTWADMVRQLNLPKTASPFDPEHSIRAGAYYMGQLRNQWIKVERPENERRALAQACYNAGLGNILKAQRLAKGASDYNTIISRLHDVTGDRNADETRTYVQRIGRIYLELSAGGA